MSDITEQISKIAPQRPGLQRGNHGDPTTGAINSLSAPNLVQLELLKREDRRTDGETEGRRRRRSERKPKAGRVCVFVLEVCARKGEGTKTAD